MDAAPCPYCQQALRDRFLYVRGIGAALHVSDRADTGVLSRANLEQIDLDAIASGGTGAQAVVPALQCDACGSLSVRTG